MTVRLNRRQWGALLSAIKLAERPGVETTDPFSRCEKPDPFDQCAATVEYTDEDVGPGEEPRTVFITQDLELSALGQEPDTIVISTRDEATRVRDALNALIASWPAPSDAGEEP